MKNPYTLIKIIIFIALLALSNLYLFKDGYWFAQDTSYWPKNSLEAYTLFIQQFRVFTNTGYYLGFDQGLFNFTRIVMVSIISLLANIFGFAGSQIAFSLLGFVITFFSFYSFSGIFFKNKNIRFSLSLLYTFNPLAYTQQGHVLYNAAVPLFLFSYYKYFYGSKKIRMIYLLINTFACFIWISYIRFLQGNFFVIIPYVVYWFFSKNKKILLKKLLILTCSYALIFAPIIYSFVSQLLERSQTAFYYGDILGKFVTKEKMIKVFNPFQSFGISLYANGFWVIAGTIFFITVVTLLITDNRKSHSKLLTLNLAIVLISMALYGLGNVVGDYAYLQLIGLFPFVINGPFFALFIQNLPFAVLIGLLTEKRKVYLYLLTSAFVIIATLPLLNLGSKQFNNFEISTLSSPYSRYFVEPHYDIPESTYYVLSPCWRAKYMEKVTDENICLNFGLHYSSATLSDPRFIAGERYKLAQILSKTTNVDDLRVTHNLKSIILPHDVVKKEDIKITSYAKKYLDSNPELKKDTNGDFTHYSYIDKNFYDFYIYPAREIIYKNNLESIDDNDLKIQNIPIVLRPPSTRRNSELQNVKIAYKISPLNATKYYLHISDIKNAKPFVIQFNQDFNSAWKVKLVDKPYFDGKKCISIWETFRITNNKRCQFHSRLVEIEDIGLLTNPELNNSVHLQSNYFNNGWLITPEDNRDLYVVIINEKQIYYNIAILVFGATLITLSSIVISQEIRNKYFN